ncbi:hypothetical protein HETIRDRAFT_448542 [Heterobasidion irregulare TC 32-1]|uniref:Uncharacterized protein n=1 Tax=Heterobasidion irregulare (strain TC 32-1) TaxID=747525 RepID=W4KIB2_HETIT|nr:uncharacterized protein HETIRDRAFT_448542 [Heterobasidion irregulare TC 32-1]ETW85444.1 hypothetical protein HETIRDRAFT_448542 [Heterobasidion irregulare TC 32-1]
MPARAPRDLLPAHVHSASLCPTPHPRLREAPGVQRPTLNHAPAFAPAFAFAVVTSRLRNPLPTPDTTPHELRGAETPAGATVHAHTIRKGRSAGPPRPWRPPRSPRPPRLSPYTLSVMRASGHAIPSPAFVAPRPRPVRVRRQSAGAPRGFAKRARGSPRNRWTERSLLGCADDRGGRGEGPAPRWGAVLCVRRRHAG